MIVVVYCPENEVPAAVKRLNDANPYVNVRALTEQEIEDFDNLEITHGIMLLPCMASVSWPTHAAALGRTYYSTRLYAPAGRYSVNGGSLAVILAGNKEVEPQQDWVIRNFSTQKWKLVVLEAGGKAFHSLVDA